MREIEIKLKVPDLEMIVSKLEKLGCTISKPVTQTDLTFFHKDDVKWFEPTIGDWCYGRLRLQVGKPPTFTVKKPLKNEMDCREHELHIDDPEALRGMMELLGYKEGMTVIKTRRTVTYQDYEITLDEVEGLGSFIEIEQVVDDGDAETIQQGMFKVAKDVFNLEPNAHVMRGYDILLYEAKNGTK